MESPIAHNDAIESPVFAQDVLQEHRIFGAVYPFDTPIPVEMRESCATGVVGHHVRGHHGPGLCVLLSEHKAREDVRNRPVSVTAGLRVEVNLPEGARRHDRFCAVALVLLVVADEMLDRGGNSL